MGGSTTPNSESRVAARRGLGRLGAGAKTLLRGTAALAVAAVALPAITTLVSVAGPGADAGAAINNPPLTCTAGTGAPVIYNLTGSGNFYALNTGTRANTPAAPSTLAPSTSEDNALGINQSGTVAYSMDQTVSGGTSTLAVTTISSGAASDFTVPSSGGGIVAGGFDPANGEFYYGGWNTADTTFTLYAFNGTTGSEVGTITPGGTYGSGDLTFDGSGDVYVLGGASGAGTGKIFEVVAPVPTSGTGALTAKTIATLSGSGNFDGIAFGANSLLYAEDSGGDLYSISPGGTITTLGAQTGLSGTPTDLASCSYNGTLELQKNIAGRSGPNDQFQLAITGGGLSTGNTGVTSGSTTGLQTASSEIAGPVVALPSSVYTITETAASTTPATNLANYSASYNCVNGSASFASGPLTLASGAFSATLPAFPQPSGASGAMVVCTITNTPMSSSLTVMKSASPTTYSASGQTIGYSFLVKNTGFTTLNGIAVNDGLAGITGLNCPIASLAPGASETCTGSYSTSQADVDNGSVTNTATAQGTPTGSSTPVVSPPSSATIRATQSAAITLSKTVNGVKGPIAITGPTTLNYAFTATNSGNVTLTGVNITDTPFSGLSALSCGSATNGSITLAPGASATCTATYAVNQAAIDAGTSIVDTGTVTGATPSSDTTKSVSNTSNTVTVNITQSPSLTVVKSASPTTYSASGQTIGYSFLVTNNGNVTMNNIAINDGLAGITGLNCPNASLAVGAFETCTGSYSTSQADVDNGSVTNTATAQGTAPGTSTVTKSPPSTATISATQSAAITLSKTVNGVKGPIAITGPTTLNYAFTATNSGNVTLTGVNITDTPFSGLSALSCGSATNGSITLAPGASATCTATYAVNQAAIDAGTSIVDTGTVTGATPSSDTTKSVSNTSNTVTVNITQSPSLTVVKSASPTTYSASGQTIGYSFLVTNNGNVTMNNIAINDGLAGITGLNCPNASLAVGAFETCTGSYSTSQADVDNGSVTNTATAQGTAPGTSTVTKSPPSTATISATQSAAITLSKTVNGVKGPIAITGPTTLNYAFTATNSGNVTLTGVNITDTPFSGLSALSCGSATNGSITLAPGASATCTATYAVNQAAIDAGTSIVDTGTVTGATPSSDTTKSVSNTSNTVTVNITQSPSLTVVKSASPTTYSASGQTIGYSFLVTNNGNVTMNNIAINDGLAGITGLNCPNASLAVGAFETCTGSYSTSQADVDNGSVTNTATAQGTAPGTSTVTKSPPSTATISATQSAAITLSKTVNGVKGPIAITGPTTLNYAFTATNSGNVTLTGVNITDTPFSGLSALSCGSATNGSITLAPGASATCTATYAVNQAAIDAGTSIVDTGTVTGATPSSDTTKSVSNTSNTVTVNITQSPSLTVVKSASPTTYSASGQTIGYSFLVTNNGNVTMNNIAINDGLAGITGLNCPNASLAVGAFETCTGSYSTSQADVDNGSVTNTATAQGTAPGTSTVTKSPPSTATISATQSAAITLSKTVNGVKGPIAITGPTTLNYAFTATNSGNVTLTGVNITDTPFSGLSALSCGSATNGSITLAPGASATCTATYAVNQAAIDAGTSIVDTGTVTGATPASDTSQPTVSNTSNTVTVNITQSPSLKVVKSASVSSVSAAGQTYTYTFAVTNNGNVTESNIGIADTQSTPSLAANLGPITCPQSSLAPGGAENCTALYTVSQADMDAGSIGDTAQATGTAPNGSTTKSPGYGAVVTTVQSPSLSLTKSASVTQVSQVGQQVTYTFAVKNTGNVSVNAIAIADTQSAPSVAANLSPITCPQPTLAPGAAENCTATYTVTQVDLNHGTITDTATASGKTTIGTTVKSNPSSVTIQAVQTIMSGRAFDIGLDVGVTGIALVGPVTVNDTGGVETAAATTTPTPCVAAAAVKDLAITGDVCAGVTTTTNPGVSTATSSIANVAVGVAGIPAIDLQAVQSTSTTSCAGSSGSVTIAYLSVGGVVVISKPTVIAPNTGLSLGVVSLVLNQQTPFNIGGDKGLTVNAVHVQVDALGLAGVNLVVGSSTSDIECAVPTQAPVLTGEANDVDLLGAALGTTVGANVVVNDTSPVITNQASTTTPACAASAAVVDLTLTGNVCASVTTKPTVGTTPASSTATASVANLVTGLGIPVITLKAVQSTSTTSCTASSGSVTIAYLQIGTTVVIAKPTTILPNTRVVVGPVTLILNQQIPFNGADTGLIVNAVAISVTTGGVLTAFGTIASSTSDILDC